MDNYIRIHKIQQELELLEFKNEFLDVNSILPNPEEGISVITDLSNISNLCLKFEDLFLSNSKPNSYDYNSLRILNEREKVANKLLFKSAQDDMSLKFSEIDLFAHELLKRKNDDLDGFNKFVEILDKNIENLENAVDLSLNSLN